MQPQLSVKDSKRRTAILEGNLWKTIMILAVPLAIYNLFNYLYTFIDMILVANIGSSQVNVVVFIDQIKSAISAFGVAIASAGTVVVARYYGAGDIEEARKNAGSTFILSLLISGLVAIITVGFGPMILKATGATDQIITDGLDYYNIQMLSTTLIAINSVFIGLEKAKGNTKIILMLNLIVMIVKLTLSIVYVYLFDGTVTDLAMATLIAQGLLTIIAVLVMFNKTNIFRIKFSEMKLKKMYVMPIVKLSVPIFFGRFLFSAGKVAINGLALQTHPYAVGALGIAMNLHGGFSALVNSFEESEVSVISQNLGNKNLKRAMNTFKISVVYATVISVIGLIILVLAQDYLIPLFSSSKPGEELTLEQFQMIKYMFKWEKYSLLTSTMISLITSLFIAFRKTSVSFFVNVIRLFVFRLPVLFIFLNVSWFSQFVAHQYEFVGLTMFISNTVTMIITIVLYLIFNHKIKHYGYEGLSL
ncbi:MAG: hypothetical protein GX312_04240 [Candidatus Phytoplasma sp.]|nr:hypothetical protein [Phytoplasma sp.]